MRALGFAIVVAMVGCGGDDGNGKPAVDTSEANVCDQVAAVACYDLYQCCSEGEIEQRLGVTDPRTQEQCREDVVRICERNYARFQDSFTAKRVTFTATAMNECLKALLPTETECATVGAAVPWVAPCMETVWTGAVADAGMCFYNYECAGVGPNTSYCAPNQTCKALPVAGQPCSQQGCADGFYCQAAMCAPLVGVGGMCTQSNACAKDLYCDFNNTNTCLPVREGGEPCTSSAGCASGQCLPGTCMGNGQFCFTSANCNGTCSAGPFIGSFCSTDANCEGHCSVTTGQICINANNCPATESCVPFTCNHPTCVGEIVCTAKQTTVDYCTGPPGVLGI